MADIGIPYALADELETCELADADMVSEILPPRPEDNHKGTFGRVLMIAGSYAMPGAAVLCAQAAYRTGSGLVRLAVPREIVPILAARATEAVYVPMESLEGISYAPTAPLSKSFWITATLFLSGRGCP